MGIPLSDKNAVQDPPVNPVTPKSEVIHWTPGLGPHRGQSAGFSPLQLGSCDFPDLGSPSPSSSGFSSYGSSFSDLTCWSPPPTSPFSGGLTFEFSPRSLAGFDHKATTRFSFDPEEEVSGIDLLNEWIRKSCDDQDWSELDQDIKVISRSLRPNLSLIYIVLV